MKNYLEQVRAQYEEYPYPERDPEDERKRLYATFCDGLDWINHYCFHGSQTFRDNFRVLVAGGGTGDSAIFLAEQLRELGGEVVYLDMSTASMSIAKRRAEIRRLENITWLHESLLNLPNLDIGRFDYIDCSGVLHHLACPPQGLAALKSVLSDDGAISLMVYAKYGRTAVYQIQDLMRRINVGEENMDVKVENCRKVLGVLPKTNWYQHTIGLFPDWKVDEPIELYDLFLHSQDRAYTIPELYDYVEDEDLEIIRLLPTMDKRGNSLYDPAVYLDDETMIENVKCLDKKQQAAIAELMHGAISTHTVFVARKQPGELVLDDLSRIPYLGIRFGRQEYAALHDLICRSSGTVSIKDPTGKYKISFRKGDYTEALFKHMDGDTSLQQIFDSVAAESVGNNLQIDTSALLADFSDMYDAFRLYDWIFLRDADVPYPAMIRDMQSRI